MAIVYLFSQHVTQSWDPWTTSLHELMVKHGVTDEQLDLGIEQDDLAPVANSMHFDDVELYLNPLKLNGNEQADVRTCAHVSKSGSDQLFVNLERSRTQRSNLQSTD